MDDTSNFKKFTSKVNNTMSHPAMQAGLGIANSASDIVPRPDPVNSNDAAAAGVRDSVNSALMKLGPWGMAAAGANKIIEATGGFSQASKGLGKGLDTANMLSSFLIPGAGYFASETDKFSVDDTLTQSSSFGNTLADANTAQGNAGAKLLFCKRKADSMIKQAKADQTKAVGILDQNKALQQSQAGNMQDIQMNNQFKQNGGWGAGTVQFGQSGMKIKDLASIKKIARKSKKSLISTTLIPSKKIKNPIALHKRGGTLEKRSELEIGDASVIPGGALHAHRHHLNDVKQDLADQVTHKGVPVVTFEMGGEIEQHAEIERGEIVFRKEITQKLEELYKDGSEEAMIEAGKLISEEIVNNTIDKSGEYEIKN